MTPTIHDEPHRQYTLPVVCPKCGQQGSETWEVLVHAPGHGLDNQFVKRTSEFYERLGRKTPHRIEVVCRRCGAVLPG